ncbi:MAG TPA: four helix bundle protein [Anaerolineaceae bacterium]|nr:four helix bundle protein [Anaerolineaceae bacterium]
MKESTTLGYRGLLVWQKSLEFASTIIEMTENLVTDKKHFRLIDQIEAASMSVPMNIAEGKGRYSIKEFKHFLMIARGSLFETMTMIELFMLRNWITVEKYDYLISEATQITKMINSLNKKLEVQKIS